MIAQSINDDDIEFLAQILENEKKNHCRMRSLCFGLFVFSFVLLLMAMGLIAYTLASDQQKLIGDAALPYVGILVPLCAAMIGFFTSWCAAQNCINSIDRSLYAAHAQKYRLFAGFIGEMQCAGKKKRSVWIEMIGSVIA